MRKQTEDIRAATGRKGKDFGGNRRSSGLLKGYRHGFSATEKKNPDNYYMQWMAVWDMVGGDLFSSV